MPAGIIPAAVKEDSGHNSGANNSGNSSGGAVSGTDSESDADARNKKVLDLSQLQWTAQLEEVVEEMLMRNAFEFKSTAKEFQRYLNQQEERANVFYKVDAKTLQLKWTDIEIRTHVIPQMQQESRQRGAAVDDKELEDDLPPLEHTSVTPQAKMLAREEQKQDSGDESDGLTQEQINERVKNEMLRLAMKSRGQFTPEQQETPKKATPVISYNSSDEEEEATGESSQGTIPEAVSPAKASPVQYSKYTDLEELD